MKYILDYVMYFLGMVGACCFLIILAWGFGALIHLSGEAYYPNGIPPLSKVYMLGSLLTLFMFTKGAQRALEKIAILMRMGPFDEFDEMDEEEPK